MQGHGTRQSAGVHARPVCPCMVLDAGCVPRAQAWVAAAHRPGLALRRVRMAALTSACRASCPAACPGAQGQQGGPGAADSCVEEGRSRTAKHARMLACSRAHARSAKKQWVRTADFHRATRRCRLGH